MASEVLQMTRALFDDYRQMHESQGAAKERDRIIDQIERQICFDAQADDDGRCSNHGGKCYELRLLVNGLIKGENK